MADLVEVLEPFDTVMGHRNLAVLVGVLLQLSLEVERIMEVVATHIAVVVIGRILVVVAMHLEAAAMVAFIRSMAARTMAASLNIKVVLGVATATTFACLVATPPFPFIYVSNYYIR